MIVPKHQEECREYHSHRFLPILPLAYFGLASDAMTECPIFRASREGHLWLPANRRV